MLVLGGVGFTERVIPENMYKQQSKIWDTVKYKYDYEVAKFY